MKTVKIFGLFVLIILSINACKNSTQSKKSASKVKSSSSLKVKEKQALAKKPKNTNTNDSTIQNDKKKYDTIIALSDGISDANYNFKKLELVKINEKIGFIYENGEELYPCTFDSVVDVKNNYYRTVNGNKIITKGYFTGSYDKKHYAKVEKDGKWGLITIDGKIAIPCIYDEIFDFDYTKTSRMEGPYIDFIDYNGKVAIVKKNEKWGLVSTSGIELTGFIYDSFFIPDVQLYFENRAAAKKCGKWGFLDEKGDTVSSFIYESIGSTNLENPQIISTFNGGVAVVKKEGKWGTIDLDGKEKSPFVYDYISNFIEEFTIAQKGGKWGYVNKSGEEVIPVIYDEIKWFENGLCPVRKDKLWGFLNIKGEIIVPLMYDDILVFNEVSVNGGLWFFSQDGFCAVMKNGKWGLIDKQNKTVVNFEYDGIKFTSSGLDDWRYFSEGFLSVQKGKFWSVINKAGSNNIPFEYDDVVMWSEGNVCIKSNNKWGLLDSLGRQLVPIVHKNAMDAGNFNYKTRSK